MVLALLVFGRVTTFEFVNFDDDKLIYANPNIQAPTLEGLKFHWTHSHSHLFIPVTYSVWWLLSHVALVQNDDAYTLNPWIFHATNLLFHLINVAMVWTILRRLLADDRAVVLGAILFAIHPLQAEPVSWATGLKDVLSGTFALGSIVMALDANVVARQRILRWIACGLMQILAVLCKPSAIVTPFIIVAIFWAIDAKRSVRFVLGFFGIVLSTIIVLITRKAQPALDLPPTSLWTRPLIATDSLAFYLSKLFVPIQLTIDYGRTPTRAIQTGAIWWTWIFPFLTALLVLASRNRLIQLGSIIFILALLPTLGLTPFQFQVFSTVSDRYAYLSMLGAGIVLAGMVDWLPRLHWPARALLGISALLALMQAGTWKDSQSLWEHTIEVNNRSALAYHNLGQIWLARGDYPKSAQLFERASKIDPDDAFSWMSLARARMLNRQPREAAHAIEKFVEVFSNRSDFDPSLTSEMLQKFASACEKLDDYQSAARLRDLAQKIMLEHPTGR